MKEPKTRLPDSEFRCDNNDGEVSESARNSMFSSKIGEMLQENESCFIQHPLSVPVYARSQKLERKRLYFHFPFYLIQNRRKETLMFAFFAFVLYYMFPSLQFKKIAKP